MEQQIIEFCAVTDTSEEVARRYLEASACDLQTAIELFLANDMEQRPSTSKPDEDVRAPIPQSTGTLVDESFTASYAPPIKHKSKNSVFDKFRDFEAESRDHARAMQSSIATRASGSASSYTNGTTNNVASKCKTLESLFRPPLELIHRGSFDTAKQEAVSKKRWLLVNVQNVTEFACQALNRDIWNNSMVQDIIAANFIFWQIYHDSADGNRFSTYYPVHSYPFVCLIDPLTGEMVKVLKVLADSVSFCDTIVHFLETHIASVNFQYPDLKSDIALNASHDTDSATVLKRKLSTDVNHFNESRDVMRPGPSKSAKFDEQDGCYVPTQRSVTHPNLAASIGEQKWMDFATLDGNDAYKLMFRLPDGSKQLLTVDGSSKLEAIKLYAQTELKLPFCDYDYLLHFPYRLLNDANMAATLSSLNFNRQEIIYVEERS